MDQTGLLETQDHLAVLVGPEVLERFASGTHRHAGTGVLQILDQQRHAAEDGLGVGFGSIPASQIVHGRDHGVDFGIDPLDSGDGLFTQLGRRDLPLPDQLGQPQGVVSIVFFESAHAAPPWPGSDVNQYIARSPNSVRFRPWLPVVSLGDDFKERYGRMSRMPDGYRCRCAFNRGIRLPKTGVFCWPWAVFSLKTVRYMTLRPRRLPRGRPKPRPGRPGPLPPGPGRSDGPRT